MSWPRPPAGWARVTLGAITRPRRERVHAQDARAYVGLEDVQRNTGRLLPTKKDDGGIRSDKAAFVTGDILYARLRPNLNKVWRATTNGACSTEFIILRRLRGVDPDFLTFRLLADDLVAFATSSSNSSLYPRVSYETLSRFEFDFPPLAEQTRIARRVRTLLDRLEEAQIDLVDARARAIAYRRSLLDRAFVGELTEDWRTLNPPGESSDERLANLRRRHTVERARRNTNRYQRASEGIGTAGPALDPLPAARTRGHSGPVGWLLVPWAEIGFEQNGRAFSSGYYTRGVMR